MAAESDALKQEIARVVTSPYPTQSKTLYDIASCCQDADIHSWAGSWPCRIEALAAALIEGLPQWPYVLQIITRFACNLEIRNAILRADPTLLGRLVSHAVDIRHGSTKYTEAAVSLLALPLPSDIALPATAQELLLQCFEKATKSPSIDTMRIVHSLSQGSCRVLLGTLPSETMSQLKTHMFNTLRGVSQSPFHKASPTLYCLSISKDLWQLSSTVINITSNDVVGDSTEIQDKSFSGQIGRPDELARFFVGERAQKVLDSVALHVVSVSAPAQAVPLTDLSTQLELAISIVHAMSEAARHEWMRRQAALYQKLQERCFSASSESIKLQILIFLGTVSGTASLPTQAVGLYSRSLTQVQPFKTWIPSTYLPHSLDIFAPAIAQGTWVRIFGQLITSFLSVNAGSELEAYDTWIELAGRMSELAETTPLLRTGVSSCLATEPISGGIHELLNTNVETTTPYAENNIGRGCSATTMAQRKSLGSAICALILHCALATQPDEHRLPSASAIPLIKKLAYFSDDTPRCNHRVLSLQRRPTDLHFVEAESTPNNAITAQNWRNDLHCKVREQATSQEEILRAYFSDACRALEVRCETIEAPSREEQAKFAELQARHDALSTVCGEMEGQVMDRDLRISALETENDQHSEEMDRLNTRCQELCQQLKAATGELQHAHSIAEEDRKASDTRMQELEMDYAGTTARIEEEIEQLKERLRAEGETAQSLRSDSEHAEMRSSQSSKENGMLLEELDNLKRRRDDDQQAFARMEREHDDLVSKQAGLEAKFNDYDESSAAKGRQCDSLQAEIRDLRSKGQQELEDSHSSYEHRIVEATSKWDTAKSTLEQQLHSSQENAIRAEEHAAAQHERWQEKVSDLRNKISRSQKECAKKDAQVAEAQEMRNRLMSAMGLGGAAFAQQQPIEPTRSLPVRSSTSQRTSNMTTQTPPPSTPARPVIYDGAEEESVDCSFAPTTGRTPKRARPHKSFKVPSLQPRASLGPRSARSVIATRSALRRQPLADVDANRSPTHGRSPSKVTFKEVGGEVVKPFGTATQMEFEDLSFTAGDVFASTPGIALVGGSQRLEEDGDPDATADAQ